MRIFGLLNLLIGLVIAFGYPYYHQAFSNFEVGKYTIFDRTTGYAEQTIWLAPEDAPLEIDFSAVPSGAESSDSQSEVLLVEIKNGENVIRSETVRFSDLNSETGLVEASLQPLEIAEGALHNFSFGSGEGGSTGVNTINMTITGLATPKSETIPTVGYALVGLGALMYLVGGRRKSKRVGNAPSGTASKTSQIGRRAEKQSPKQAKPTKDKPKWGRDADG